MLVIALSSLGSLCAQSLSDTIIERERALLAVEHTAQGGDAIYLPSFEGINAQGGRQTRRPGSLFQSTADPNFVLEQPLTVHPYQSAVLVTGVQAVGGVRRVRFVRVWVRDGDGDDWKLAIHQGSPIGQRANVTPVTSAAPAAGRGRALSDEEAAVLRIQEALWQGYAQHDAAIYERWTAPEFVSVTSLGQVIPRDQWLKDEIADNQEKRILSSQDVMVHIFGDVGVVTYLSIVSRQDGTATSAQRRITIFARKNGSWQQVHAQSTTMVQAATINSTPPQF
jgi:hypothetical protein